MLERGINLTQKKGLTFSSIHTTTDFPELDHSPKSRQSRTLKEITLQGAGFPLRLQGDRDSVSLSTDNIDLFQAYAREQWTALMVRGGDYLFDRCMFPDYAFKVIDCKPHYGRIGRSTTIKLDPGNTNTISREFPDATFEDVIGHEAGKRKGQIILQYLKDPAKFGEWSPRNIMFYGPPGTGKTLLARSLAGEAKVPILMVKATELLGMHVGEGSSHIHRLYRMASGIASSIVFIDEVDAIALNRRYQAIRGDVTEIVNALLSELDGITENHGVVTIVATNANGLIDGAINSRFEERIEFPLPTFEERQAMIYKWISTFPIPIEMNTYKVAKVTRGYSGRELRERILKQLLHNALLDQKSKIIEEDITSFLAHLVPSSLSVNSQKGLIN